jgi:hypothetical protein
MPGGSTGAVVAAEAVRAGSTGAAAELAGAAGSFSCLI